MEFFNNSFELSYSHANSNWMVLRKWAIYNNIMNAQIDNNLVESINNYP